MNIWPLWGRAPNSIFCSFSSCVKIYSFFPSPLSLSRMITAWHTHLWWQTKPTKNCHSVHIWSYIQYSLAKILHHIRINLTRISQASHTQALFEWYIEWFDWWCTLHTPLEESIVHALALQNYWPCKLHVYTLQISIRHNDL